MKHLIFLLLTLWTFHKAEAQVANYQPLSYQKFRVMGVPQMLFLHGLRIDFDLPHNDGKEWIILSPELYFKSKDDNQFDTKYESMYGARLGIANRIHFMNGRYITGWYISYGAVIEYFNLTRKIDGWVSTPNEGLEYLTLKTVDKTNQAFRPGIEFTIGNVLNLDDNLILDYYFGSGFRYCFFDGTSDEKSLYAKDMFGKTHSGAVFLAGIRLGVSIPKQKATPTN